MMRLFVIWRVRLSRAKGDFRMEGEYSLRIYQTFRRFRLNCMFSCLFMSDWATISL